jgi:hypothetical protein
MPCCCLKRLNLCAVDVCNGFLVLDTLAEAPESGVLNVYTLQLYYLNTRTMLKQEQVEGEKITFDVSSLNEDFEYEGQVFDSAGDRVTLDDGYDCLKFKTFI